MPTYCRICGRSRPSENFKGHGRKRRICKTCLKLPAATLEKIQAEDEMCGFLRQRHISDKNIARLRIHRDSANPVVSEMAKVVLEVAQAFPYKKRRMVRITGERKDLLPELERVRLLEWLGDMHGWHGIEDEDEDEDLNFE